MKNRLWIILSLFVIWYGFSDGFSISNLFLGVFFATLIPYLVLPDKPNFYISFPHLIVLISYMIWELFRSSIEVAWDILMPRQKNQPKLINFQLKSKHPIQMSMLANLISLTPGTIVVSIDEIKKILIIHIMFKKNEKKIIALIKNKLEPAVAKVIRYV